MVDPTTPTRKEIEQISLDSNGQINFRVVRAFESLFEVAAVTLPDEIASLFASVSNEGGGQQTTLNADYIDFSPNGPQLIQAKRAKWDEDTGTVLLGLTEDTTTPIGQELLYRAENNTGSTITKGETVRIIGGGTNGYPDVALFTAGTDTNARRFMGIASEDIADGELGLVVRFGLVGGLDTSSFSENTVLYASTGTAGGLRSTEPSAPGARVIVGIVTESHATTGKIMVSPQIGRSLGQLHDVQANSPSNGQVPIWNQTNERYEVASIAGGTGITVTLGAGSIDIINSKPAGGASGNFTTVDGKTVTVVGGLITTIV